MPTYEHCTHQLFPSHLLWLQLCLAIFYTSGTATSIYTSLERTWRLDSARRDWIHDRLLSKGYSYLIYLVSFLTVYLASEHIWDGNLSCIYCRAV